MYCWLSKPCKRACIWFAILQGVHPSIQCQAKVSELTLELDKELLCQHSATPSLIVMEELGKLAQVELYFCSSASHPHCI